MTNTVRSYKPAFILSGQSAPALNGQAFPTWAEANASASYRFMAWTMPTGYCVVESDEQPNYHRDDHRDVSGAISDERARVRAEYVCSALQVAGQVIDAINDANAEPMFMEPWSQSVATSRLPAHVRAALVRIGYVIESVRLECAHDKIVVSASADDGRQAIVASAIAGADGGKVVIEHGPFGGPNMHGKCSIELCPVRAIPVGGAIVTGQTSNGKRRSSSAIVHARAVDALSWLAPEAPECAVAHDAMLDGRMGDARESAFLGLASLASPVAEQADAFTEAERVTLACFAGYKSHARREAIARAIDSEAERAAALQSLARAGLIKVARNGAASLTPMGRNVAAECPRVY